MEALSERLGDFLAELATAEKDEKFPYSRGAAPAGPNERFGGANAPGAQIERRGEAWAGEGLAWRQNLTGR